MNVPQRRGACPGLSAPMVTGDGLLVRLLPTDRIMLDDFVALCAAAREHGNGIIEVTARGSLQVRGLTARSAPAFARAIAGLDIAAAEGVSVIADPLPDGTNGIIDTTAIAATLRRAIADAGLALAPKISVVVDGGGPLHLDTLAADVRLRAIGSAQAPRFHVSVGGDAGSATPLGSVPLRKAADVVVNLLEVIAAHGANERAVDVLRRCGAETFYAAIGEELERAPALPPRSPAEMIGRHRLRDGSIALGIALTFGHAPADALVQVAHSAAVHGADSVRLAPGRALLLLGLTHGAAAALEAEAERQGFIVRADDARRRIIACAGKPACASGLIAARELASALAPHLSARPETVHISGCAKGCAHPGIAALTVVGGEHGCGIIANGTARAVPDRLVDCSEMIAEVLRVACGATSLVRSSSSAETELG
jgi:precorrin-3B synthase